MEIGVACMIFGLLWIAIVLSVICCQLGRIASSLESPARPGGLAEDPEGR